MYYADVKSKTVSYVKKYFCDTLILETGRKKRAKR